MSKIVISKGTITVDTVTEVKQTLSVVMRDAEGRETDKTFIRVTTLTKGFAKWYDEDGNLQDKDTTQELEMCYSNRVS